MKLRQILLEMPTEQPCPHCGIMVPDWYREWYPGDEPAKIYQNIIAADCPWCHNGVRFVGMSVEKALSTIAIVLRSPEAADKWVKSQKPQYPNLNSFLQSNDPQAIAYKNYKFRQ